MAASQRRWQPRLVARRQSESVLAGGMVTAAYSCDRTAAELGLRRGGTNGGSGGVARSLTEIDFKLFMFMYIRPFLLVFGYLFGLFHIYII